MGWFSRWRLRQAAKPYARRLPRQLRDGWGRSATYTRGQIDAAIRQSGLNPRHAFIGYATFLSDENLAAASELLTGHDRTATRAAFAFWRPAPAADGDFYESGLGEAMGGSESGGGHGGGHH